MLNGQGAEGRGKGSGQRARGKGKGSGLRAQAIRAKGLFCPMIPAPRALTFYFMSIIGRFLKNILSLQPIFYQDNV